jgi:hypothetical protein
VKTFVVPLAVIGFSFVSAACEQQAKNAPAAADPNSTAMKSDDPQRRIPGLDPGWQLAEKATYTASQAPNEEVTIRAAGEHPTAGYETKFVVSPLRIYPPQWMLAVKKPDGPVAQVVTPFDVTTSFKGSGRIRSLRVSDDSGQHDVPVEQED